MAAALADIFKGQDGRVVKASDSVRYSCLVVVLIPGRKFCPPKKTTWYVDGRVNSQLQFYVAATLADIFQRDRMAEWVRPSTL